MQGATIGATYHDQKIYNEYVEYLARSNRYFGGIHRAVDMEFGIFPLIQTCNIAVAQEIYGAV